ncbi:nickel-responsive transcriptional regulator NikR [Thermosulfuriphilus ammonigenes]|uniref:Putative nickel-responsive regulator n=1 Tax=Thermosulfuriphilus ammonigenes TaxID=1936021 RepID=A0A6G7PVR5_9BACT|nr:nickel-responsive transcriptional regulator NikR [Thermosulfuriphilus ammonigenes]MBA2848329.1 CopG family nickel-responsive transcriptional regulator [Thermosulfuriphilus ammonigenes]QIJ71513.1 nickel-responsive transcriptional regulator NikR [Thermosulfuriphilus ammonigenes]
MGEIYRFGVSIPSELIEAFDRYIAERHYTNRSEAIRDLIREKLVEREWEISGREVVGTITYVYDHHQRELVDRLIDLQHDYHENILAAQHIHLDHDNCLEVIIVKGHPKIIRELANRIHSTRGIKHCQLTMTTTGQDLV